MSFPFASKRGAGPTRRAVSGAIGVAWSAAGWAIFFVVF